MSNSTIKKDTKMNFHANLLGTVARDFETLFEVDSIEHFYKDTYLAHIKVTDDLGPAHLWVSKIRKLLDEYNYALHTLIQQSFCVLKVYFSFKFEE